MSSTRFAVVPVLVIIWLGAPTPSAAAQPVRAQLARVAHLEARLSALQAENAQLLREVGSLKASVEAVRKSLDTKTATYDRLYERTAGELEKQKTMWTSMITLYIGLVVGCATLLTFLGWRLASTKIRKMVAQRLQELVTAEVVQRVIEARAQALIDRGDDAMAARLADGTRADAGGSLLANQSYAPSALACIEAAGGQQDPHLVTAAA